MRTLIMTLMICSFAIHQSLGQGKSNNQSTLTGKVFSSKYGLDKVNCKIDTIIKDNNITFIFLNDSSFVQVNNNCCPHDTTDFAFESYYIGKYKIENNYVSSVV